MQRARDRRRAEGEHIDLGAQLFELLFVGNAKALFFIDDDHPQLFEINIVAEQPMGADDKVDAAFA